MMRRPIRNRSQSDLSFSRISNGNTARRLRVVVVSSAGELKQVKNNVVTHRGQPMRYCYQLVEGDDYIITTVMQERSRIPSVSIKQGMARAEVPAEQIVPILNSIHPIIQRYLLKY